MRWGPRLPHTPPKQDDIFQSSCPIFVLLPSPSLFHNHTLVALTVPPYYPGLVAFLKSAHQHLVRGLHRLMEWRHEVSEGYVGRVIEPGWLKHVLTSRMVNLMKHTPPIPSPSRTASSQSSLPLPYREPSANAFPMPVLPSMTH